MCADDAKYRWIDVYRNGGAVGGGAYMLVWACAHTYSPEHIHCKMHRWKRPLNLNRVKLSVCSRSVFRRKKRFFHFTLCCRLVFLLPSSTSFIHFAIPIETEDREVFVVMFFSAIQLRRRSSLFFNYYLSKVLWCAAARTEVKWMKATTRESCGMKKRRQKLFK